MSSSTGIPVVVVLVRLRNERMLRVAMNTTKRLFLGVISALLFAVGLARAADRFDPMTKTVGAVNTDDTNISTMSCTDPCWID